MSKMLYKTYIKASHSSCVKQILFSSRRIGRRRPEDEVAGHGSKAETQTHRLSIVKLDQDISFVSVMSLHRV